MKLKLVATFLVMSFILATCSKNELLNSASDVLNSLREAQPLIEQFLPKSADKINQAVTIGIKLKDGIAASDSTTAVGQIRVLIPIFQSIVKDDIPQIKDVNTRTQIMAALALANIALSLLANRLTSNTSMAAGPNDPVRSFAKEPVWGTAYRTKK